MRLLRFTMSSALLCGSVANAQQLEFCSALDRLHQAAVETREPQCIEILSFLEPVFACRRSNTPVTSQFCDAAAPVVGVEFTDIFPWRVHDCLVASGVQPTVNQVDERTGMDKKKIIHLAAQWPDGAHIDIRFIVGRPGDSSADYKGEYELVVRHR